MEARKRVDVYNMYRYIYVVLDGQSPDGEFNESRFVWKENCTIVSSLELDAKQMFMYAQEEDVIGMVIISS